MKSINQIKYKRFDKENDFVRENNMKVIYENQANKIRKAFEMIYNYTKIPYI
jgi:hypothetical protein